MVKMLVVLLIVGFAAVPTFAGGAKETDQAKTVSTDWMIGIMTGTVAQNEEEFRKAEAMQKALGANRVVLATYPERFMQEQETTISNMMAMASNPKVKAIVMVQAVPGAAAAVDRVRAIRPDMLIILGVPGEDPDVVAKKGDIIMQTNDLARGEQTIKQAKALGAKTFVHYSFPRHMSYELLSKRRTLMKEASLKHDVKFLEQDAPDPTGDAGVPGTQQFIMEDVPRKIQAFGKDTAFFGTNCAMQEPMIRQVVANGGVFPIQCCPSPFHAMPGALGIKIAPENKGDVKWILGQTREAISKTASKGRVSTWPVPVNMMYIESSVEYAKAYLEGKIKSKSDKAAMQAIMEKIAGGKVDISNYKNYDNYYLFLADFVQF
jgi:hypothetical protein